MGETLLHAQCSSRRAYMSLPTRCNGLRHRVTVDPITPGPATATAAAIYGSGSSGQQHQHQQLIRNQLNPYTAVVQHLSSINTQHQPAEYAQPIDSAVQMATAAPEANPPIALAATASRPAVAIDVEYSHLILKSGQKVAVPAWVAVVDEQCNLLLNTFIQPGVSSGMIEQDHLASVMHSPWCSDVSM